MVHQILWCLLHQSNFVPFFLFDGKRCLVKYTRVCKILVISWNYVPKIAVELNDKRLSARASPKHRSLWIILLILIREVIVLSLLSMLNVLSVLSVPPIYPPLQTSPPYDTPSEIDEVVLIAGKLTPKIFPTYNFTLSKYRPLWLPSPLDLKDVYLWNLALAISWFRMVAE